MTSRAKSSMWNMQDSQQNEKPAIYSPEVTAVLSSTAMEKEIIQFIIKNPELGIIFFKQNKEIVLSVKSLHEILDGLWTKPDSIMFNGILFNILNHETSDFTVLEKIFSRYKNRGKILHYHVLKHKDVSEQIMKEIEQLHPTLETAYLIMNHPKVTASYAENLWEKHVDSSHMFYSASGCPLHLAIPSIFNSNFFEDMWGQFKNTHAHRPEWVPVLRQYCKTKLSNENVDKLPSCWLEELILNFR